MSITCTHCDGSGFLNLHQIPDMEYWKMDKAENFHEEVLKWIAENGTKNDVTVCDCCGDGDKGWYDEPGEHYNKNDPPGNTGPYAYNGGLCECD